MCCMVLKIYSIFVSPNTKHGIVLKKIETPVESILDLQNKKETTSALRF